MSIAGLIEQMAAAGAPIDAIVLAVRAVEEGTAVEAERRARATERKRRERDRKRDGHATVTGQSPDTSGYPPSPPSFPTPPNTPLYPPRLHRTRRATRFPNVGQYRSPNRDRSRSRMAKRWARN